MKTANLLDPVTVSKTTQVYQDVTVEILEELTGLNMSWEKYERLVTKIKELDMVTSLNELGYDDYVRQRSKTTD